MDGDESHFPPPPQTRNKTLVHRHHPSKKRNGAVTVLKTKEPDDNPTAAKRKSMSTNDTDVDHDHDDAKSKAAWLEKAYFMKWRTEDVVVLVRCHPVVCVMAACVLFFMGVEYTLRMIPYSSPPFDLGFVATIHLNRLLAARPFLNNFLAGLNTAFVGIQTAYILETFLLEGRPRATISAIFMFTCRGILGYVTQLPVPQDFLGSGVDFPVGNVSFFLFYSGHVAASVVASQDMKRMQRWEMARAFDALNLLQIVRLLSTRGHYTIDLVVGVGAGIFFDSMAGKYLESKKKVDMSPRTYNGYSALCSLQL